MDFTTASVVQNAHFLVENEETHGPLLSKHEGIAPPSHAGDNPDKCSSLYLPSSFKHKSFMLCPLSSDWKGKGWHYIWHYSVS